MKKALLLKSMLLLFALIVGSSSMWAQTPTVLFHETFGNNTGSARDWNNSYSVKTGVLSVYSGASYTVTNAKQSKNTMGQTQSGLVSGQGKTGTFIVGPLSVSNYENLSVTNYFGMSASSWNTSYSFMKLSYSTDNSTYTELTRSGSNPSKAVSSNKNLVQASYTLPSAAQSNTLYLKFEFYCYQLNSSNSEIGQAYFDEVELKGSEKQTSVTAPTFNNTGGEVTYGTTVTVSNYNDDYLYFFTTDNTDPDCDSSLNPVGTSQSYDNNDGITITDDVTLKMIAVDGDGNKSIVSTAIYTLIRPDSPTMNPNGGIVTAGATVTLEQDDATLIMYTLNGADPSFANSVGTEYTGPITINTTTTIKAVAVDDNGVESAITEATFFIVEGENDFSWNLATNSYVSNPAPTENLIQWSNSYVTMKNEKGSSSTGVNNYIPTAQTSTRFYAKNELTITPASGVDIKAIVFTATTDGYATALANSSWTNASAGASEKTVIIVPTFGTSPVTAVIGATTGHNNVKIYFNELPSNVTITPAKAVTTYVTTCNLDFEGINGLDAFVATAAANGVVTLAEVGAVPAGTPLLLRGTASTDYSVPVVAPATAPTTNLLRAGDGETTIGGDGVYDYILSDGFWYHASAGTVAVGKAYLHCESDPTTTTGGAPSLSMDWGEGTTGIVNVNRETINDNQYYTLDGRRVAEPTKGLYILNGKKVIVK